jgi:hypothetical protein
VNANSDVHLGCTGVSYLSPCLSSYFMWGWSEERRYSSDNVVQWSAGAF